MLQPLGIVGCRLFQLWLQLFVCWLITIQKCWCLVQPNYTSRAFESSPSVYVQLGGPNLS